jgi:hypothetical protein
LSIGKNKNNILTILWKIFFNSLFFYKNSYIKIK